MPRIDPSVQMTAVTVAEIQDQVDRIETILEGRIEDDNLYNDGAKYATIQPKKVVNMADETRPVDGFKFFSKIGADSFENKILTPILDKYKKDIQPLILYGNTSFVFNNSTMEMIDLDSEREEKMNVFERSLDFAGDTLQKIGNPIRTASGFLGRSGGGNLFEQAEAGLESIKKEYFSKYKGKESWERRVVSLPKTPFIKPMTKDDVVQAFGGDDIEVALPYFFDKQGNQYFMSVTYYADMEVAALLNNFRVEIESDDPDLIEVAVYLSTVGFDKEDYFTLQIGVEILCKEVQ